VSIVLAPDFVLTLLDRDASGHADAAAWVGVVEEDLVTTPLALAAIDAGAGEAAPAVRDDFARGAYAVRWWADALDETLALSKKRQLDLVRASLVALAGRLRTDRVATFDPTFEKLQTPAGKPFAVLPERTR
jgi:predicted nucleic acid-binding protein